MEHAGSQARDQRAVDLDGVQSRTVLRCQRVELPAAHSRLGLDDDVPVRREPVVPKRTIVFDDDADELDVPDFLK